MCVCMGGGESTEREKGETYIVLAQICRAMPGEEEEEAEWRRDTKNRITGLDLTQTSIQRGDTILLNCPLVSSQERPVLLFNGYV